MIRALVVDDEAPARAKLGALLGREPDFTVVGEAKDGREAVMLVTTLQPDVVFLDVQMPVRDGFAVVADVGPEAMPLTVFVTAYDQHALQAFEVEALDYLLKPFATARLQRVLDRVRKRLEQRDTAELALRVERALETAGPSQGWCEQLLVERTPGRQKLLPIDAIDLFRADRNDVRVFTSDGEYVRDGPLAALAERLDPRKFLRINRSEIVRIEAVRELQPWFHGDYKVLLEGSRMLTWSRRYRARDKSRF
jgi:two-component system, LytTR family, response regulator